MKNKKTTKVSAQKPVKAEKMTEVFYVRSPKLLKKNFGTISKKKKVEPTIRIRKMVEEDVEKHKHLL